MSQNTDGLNIPPYPDFEPARSYATKFVGKIEHDLKAVQNGPNHARALAWNAHDRDVQDIVSRYNDYLRNTPGYASLDWHLVKAMLLTETEPYAPGDKWDKNPCNRTILETMGGAA